MSEQQHHRWANVYVTDAIETRANNIQPIFVFPGLAILRKDKPFSHEDRRPVTRANGWDLYDKNRVDNALQTWGNGGGIHLADLCNYVCHILHEHGIEFIRAPYSAWAQVRTHEPKGKSITARSHVNDSLPTCILIPDKLSVLSMVVPNY